MPDLNVGAGHEHYRRLFEERRKQHGAIDRSSIPTPARYLRDNGLLTNTVRGEWVALRCPAHKGGAETHPSLRVSLIDGHFRCMTCGAKGGDVIALHRLFTGCSFAQALRDLGALQ